MATKREYWLVWRMGETDGAREVRARYTTLEEARAQAEADLAAGRQIVRIEDERSVLVWSLE